MTFRPERARTTDPEMELSADEQVTFSQEVVQPFRQDAFNPDDFCPDPYSEVKIGGDQRAVVERRKGHDMEGSGDSALFEYALMAGFEDHGWLGDEVKSVRKSAGFDDVFHGVDFVVTFLDEDGQEIHLAVDTTTSSEMEILQRKVKYTIDGLKRRDLTKVTYFEDLAGVKGEVKMPRVVLGMGRKEAIALQRAFIEKPTSLDNHPVQSELLSQIRQQLTQWLAVLLENHRVIDRSEYTNDAEEMLALVGRCAGRMQKDPDLYRAVIIHAHTLATVLRAERIRKKPGAESPRRASGSGSGNTPRPLIDPLDRGAAAS